MNKKLINSPYSLRNYHLMVNKDLLDRERYYRNSWISCEYPSWRPNNYSTTSDQIRSFTM